MTVQLQALKPIATVKPADLFDIALPKTLADYHERGMKLVGTFEISVFGTDGGSWFIDAERAVCRRYQGERTDCLLEMGTAEFAALTTGRLDVDRALDEGTLRFRGDAEKLVTLGHLRGG